MPRRGPGGARNLALIRTKSNWLSTVALRRCKLGNGEEGRRVRACLGVRQRVYLGSCGSPLSWQLNLMPYCAPGKPQRPAPERRTIR